MLVKQLFNCNRLARLSVRPVLGVRYNFSRSVSTNYNDPDAHKPTLDIEPFSKSERLGRPVAPHLTIYQPQLTWVMSAAHRITGAGVAGVLYLVAGAYALLPVDAAVLVNYVHSYPFFVVFLGKAIIGFPLFFHSFNGIRHLIWDTANQLTLKGVYNTGYIVLGLSTVATLAFALFY
ncbi:cytochrome b subunit of succinate dehydrogenase, Sdh3p [Boothiomyces sp. JEL0866]|nr:cytochrome b subunit of succinate dehydrogenase, Sdh3p [Boothiomyces sp. JEL0866]